MCARTQISKSEGNNTDKDIIMREKMQPCTCAGMGGKVQLGIAYNSRNISCEGAIICCQLLT
jgi:hypothetical protein